MTTDADGTPAQRDLILGLTNAADVGAPGLVLMSKIAPGPPPSPFTATDLAGPWRVYLQRVESSKVLGGTWQVGLTTFAASGAFGGGSLQDLGNAVTTLTAGALLVSANGSVTGTLSAGAAATADRYTIAGTMRAAKDLITGVVSAEVNGRTKTFHGLVTMVREVTLFDFGQSAYSVTEGGTVTVTVLRTGNRAGTSTVAYAAVPDTAPPADYQPASGTLTFGPSIGSATFTVKTNPNTLVDGNRSVSLVLSNPTGAGALLGARPSATLTIVDEDKAGTVKLGAAIYNLAESGKNVGVTIQRSLGSASGVVVQFATSDGTAQSGRDYTAVNGSVTFNAGETTKTVQVPIADTPVVDGSRAFTFAITGVMPPSTVLGNPSSAQVTIGDLDVAGTLQFSAATYTTTEPPAGSGSVTITVTRTGGMAGGVLVSFAAADGSATAGTDYTATSGTLTFGLGNTSMTFSIPILADTLIEGDETVLISLSSPQGGGALGVQKTAVLTIKDAQKGVQFSGPTFTAAESAASATVTVVRTGPTPDVATVRYSTSDGTAKAGMNYKPASGTLTFAKDVTKATFSVPLLGDKQVKGPQTVLLLLSNPTSTALGPLSSAVLTIGDIDAGGVVKLAAPTFSISEAAGSAVITVSRSGGTAGGVTVDFEATDQPCGAPPCPGKAQGGFDYQAVSGTLTFGVGETTKTVLIPVTNDVQVNGNRAFLVNLSNVQGGAALATPSSAVVTIVNDDQGGVFQFSAPTYGVTEPAAVTTTATIKVTRTGSNLAGASVQFATSNGTATSGSDYTATVTTLVFGSGETFKEVAIPVLPDSDAEGNESVNLTLSNPGGGATLGTLVAAVLTIVDAVPSTRFNAAGYSVTEGTAATITVVRGGSTAGTLKVNYATSDGTAQAPADYTAKSGTLTFSAGVSTLSFTVPTLNNADTVDGRTVNLTLTPNGPGSVASPSNATLTILDNDAPGTFQFGAATYGVTEGGAAPQVMVTRTGGSGGTVAVSWTAAGTATGGALPTTPGVDYAPASGLLTFGPGVTSLKVPLTIVNDTLAENAETIILGLAIQSSLPAGAAVNGIAATTLTILDNDNGGTIQFAGAAQTVAENVAGGKINLAVTRTGASLAGGIAVNYAASGDTGAIALAPGTLTFNAGQTSAMIPVTILSNALAELDRSVVVTLSGPTSAGGASGANAPVLGAQAATTLKIVDDEPRVQFAAAGSAVVEGGSATITVTRTGSLTGQVTVSYATGGGSAVPITDYTAVSGTLTFATGVASRTFNVSTLDDGAAAGSRTVGLTLSAATGASIGGTNPATLTIQDKESAGTLQFATASATVVEGLPGDPGRTVRISVTRTGSNLVGPVTIGWAATGGTAMAGDDFTPSSGTLTFEAATTSRSFEVTALDDGVAEGTETIVLSLAAPTGGAVLGSPSATTVFIIDAQQSIAFSSPTFTVGETTAQAVITAVRLGIPTGPVTVTATTVPAAVDPSLQALAGVDYTSVSTMLTFAAGEIVKTFNVPILTANALTRNGNRIVGLELADPVNAALIGASSATLTILDFRPDLVIASVGTPGNTLAGKTLSTPTTVRNLGQVASPAFRVGIFIAKDNGSPGDALPGAGSLVVQRDVPALAAGAAMALPTQLTVAEDLPAGNYFVSAVANFNQGVTEADATNNGLSSAPSVLKVSSNFSKLQSASASFSLGNAGGGGGGGSSSLGVPAANPCDVTGSVNLSGSFTIVSQQQDTANGIADLSGSFNDEPVRFVIAFSGTADASNNINASLTSITVSGAFSATGNGTPPGTFTGTLQGATLSGNAAGTIQTLTGGDCSFSGPLTAVGQASFVFRLGTRTPVGTFNFSNTPDVPSVVTPSGYAARFHVLFDTDFPDPSTVRFTGPTGSGLSGTPADPDESHGDDDGKSFTYTSPPRFGAAPGGTWSVLYKGLTRAFTVPPLNANSSFVVIFPTVTVDSASGTLTQVNWEYRDRFGNRLSGPPSLMAGLQVEVWLNGGSEDQPESPKLAPTVTSFNLAAAGFTPPAWAQVFRLVFRYTDLVGNEYELHYGKAFSVMAETRLENVYSGGAPGSGSQERLLNIFVDVPFNSVDKTAPCFTQGTGPFLVAVQNNGAAGPYVSPQCLDFTGTTVFNDDPTIIDIFSERRPISGPSLSAGTEFLITVRPIDSGIPTQSVVATLRSSEARTPNDFIFIPNPNTPNLVPPGTRLVDAKLGQNQTISWTQPTFPVKQVTLSPIVNITPFGGGPFCGTSQQFLSPTATSATFKFPTSCFGVPVQSAQVCVFFSGENGESSAGCWFFQDPN